MTESAYDWAMSLTAKLHPDRFTEMSPKMTAIIAYVLGEEWTDPQIAWMSVSSDGYVTTDADFLGDAADLWIGPFFAQDIGDDGRHLGAHFRESIGMQLGAQRHGSIGG